MSVLLLNSVSLWVKSGYAEDTPRSVADAYEVFASVAVDAAGGSPSSVSRESYSSIKTEGHVSTCPH